MAKLTCALGLVLLACSAPPSTPRAPVVETPVAEAPVAETPPDAAPKAAAPDATPDVAAAACPDPPDRRVAACRPDKFPRPCSKYGDLSEPDCPPIEATGRVIKVDTSSSGDVFVTISVGSNGGVGKAWSATLLRGDTNEPLPGGDVALVRIDKQHAVGKVKVSADDVRANPRVRLAAP